MAAAADRQDPTRVVHRYHQIRVVSSSRRITVPAPDDRYKLLMAGVVVRGRSVVTSSYHSHAARTSGGNASSSGGDGNGGDHHGEVESWVVEHAPMSPNARIEVTVLAVFDPEAFLEMKVKRAFWRDTPLALRKWHDGGDRGPMAVLPCARAGVHDSDGDSDIEDDAAERDPERDASNPPVLHSVRRSKQHRNRWVMVGGGFVSVSPPVACGPEWQRTWQVVAEAHDALMAFTISLRMSRSYFNVSSSSVPATWDRPVVDITAAEGTSPLSSSSDSSDSSIDFRTAPSSPTTTAAGRRSATANVNLQLRASTVKFDLGSTTSFHAKEADTTTHYGRAKPEREEVSSATLSSHHHHHEHHERHSKPLLTSSVGPRGQWSVDLPQPFGAMHMLFGHTTTPDRFAVHEFLSDARSTLTPAPVLSELVKMDVSRTSAPASHPAGATKGYMKPTVRSSNMQQTNGNTARNSEFSNVPERRETEGRPLWRK